MTWRVFIYVQHLLGIGHLVRTSRIASALADGPFEVTVASGGVPVPQLDFGKARVVQLPPVRADASGFSALLDAQGAPFLQEAQARRAALLRTAFDDARPHALLLEAFPFARRQMRFELLPLLDHARAQTPRPLILSSIRDILQESRTPGRAEESAALVTEAFDHVLVHGDGAATPLAASFPLAAGFAEKIVYTGLVGPPLVGEAISTHDVIVSAGGGAVGEHLIGCALHARPLSPLRDLRWLLVTGPNMPAAISAEFAQQAGGRVSIERFVTQLPQRLKGAALSISQSGYNTVAEILGAGCRSVLVPFAEHGETEQTVRAQGLTRRGLAVSVVEDGLTPERLATAISAALALPPPAAHGPQDGAAATRGFLERTLARLFS